MPWSDAILNIQHSATEGRPSAVYTMFASLRRLEAPKRHERGEMIYRWFSAARRLEPAIDPHRL
jgi:hypothetical protein